LTRPDASMARVWVLMDPVTVLGPGACAELIAPRSVS
jgi:hypothetical protein